MGFFSYKCAISDISIPAYPYANLPVDASRVVMLLPSGKKIEGVYDGYGNIGYVCLYEELSDYFFGKRDRNLIFDTTRQIYDKKGYLLALINAENWQKKITEKDISMVLFPQFKNEILGKNLNSLKESGFAVKDPYYFFETYIKIVRKDHYNNESFEDLSSSQRCVNQGYFYSDEDYEKILQSLSDSDD